MNYPNLNKLLAQLPQEHLQDVEAVAGALSKLEVHALKHGQWLEVNPKLNYPALRTLAMILQVAEQGA